MKWPDNPFEWLVMMVLLGMSAALLYVIIHVQLRLL
jgi:hypothetical protein